jgi:hypothetical protein
MSDDYLWDRSGPIDAEIAGIERELGSLAWRPPAIGAQEPVPFRSIRRSEDPSHWRGWPALIAGLATAATVLAAVYLARNESDVESPAIQPSVESIDPAGLPQGSPDLKDPFSTTHDSPPRMSGDLVDPFGTTPEPPRPPRHEQTRTAPPQNDLKDPFGPSSRNPARPEDEPALRPEDASLDLKDPFSGDSSKWEQPSKASGSDLVDPFAKQH